VKRTKQFGMDFTGLFKSGFFGGFSAACNLTLKVVLRARGYPEVGNGIGIVVETAAQIGESGEKQACAQILFVA
jgi:hypothetical protein